MTMAKESITLAQTPKHVPWNKGKLTGAKPTQSCDGRPVKDSYVPSKRGVSGPDVALERTTMRRIVGLGQNAGRPPKQLHQRAGFQFHGTDKMDPGAAADVANIAPGRLLLARRLRTLPGRPSA